MDQSFGWKSFRLPPSLTNMVWRSNHNGDSLPTTASPAESQSIASTETLFRDNESEHATDTQVLETVSNRTPPDSPSDTRAVLILRIALIGVWLVVAVVFSVSVYSYTTVSQDKSIVKDSLCLFCSKNSPSRYGHRYRKRKKMNFRGRYEQSDSLFNEAICVFHVVSSTRSFSFVVGHFCIFAVLHLCR